MKSIIAFFAAAMLSVAASAAAQETAADDQKFLTALALAKELHGAERCAAAYPLYLDLQKQRRNDPDVLWGIGECSATTAGSIEDQTAKHQRFLDAKAAYEQYAATEKRPCFTNGEKNRVALARARAAQLDAIIAALLTPPPAQAAARPASDDKSAAVAVAGAPSEAPSKAGPPAAVLAPPPGPKAKLKKQERWVLSATKEKRCKEVLPVYLRIAERSKRAKVHRAGTACAEALGQTRETFLAMERYVRAVRFIGDPTVYFTIAEGFATLGERGRAKHYFEHFLRMNPQDELRRTRAEEYLEEFKHAQVACFVKRGVATSTLVPSDGGWKVQVRMLPNAFARAPACLDPD